MKLMKFFFFACVLFSFVLRAQQAKSGNLTILPFYVKGIASNTITTAEEILRLEMENVSSKNIFLVKSDSAANENSDCTSIDCASELGKKYKADQVVSVQMLTLGQKIIIQYFLIDVEQKAVLLADKLTSTSVEDLDVVMKRMAISITSLESAKKSAEVGAITENESKPFFLRSGRKYNNWSFGYLYPQKGYGTDKKSFTMDVKIGSEVDDLEYGVQLLYREGIGANIFTSYLFSRKDFCPYIGGGVGFHLVEHHQDSYQLIPGISLTQQDEKKGDGFEVLANVGLRLFHTYNFRVNINLAYTYSFNDFNSEAVVLTLGFFY